MGHRKADYRDVLAAERLMVRIVLRIILGVVAFACALFAFWVYDDFPNGGNPNASQHAVMLLEWSGGISITAFVGLLLTLRSSARPPQAR